MYHQRFKSVIERFKEKVVRAGEHWLWAASKDGGGYGFFWLNGQMLRAHRASWILHRGPIPSGLDVLHRCDITGCVNPDCLFLGTRADNNRDRDIKGRHVALKGEQHGCARLTTEDVISIRELAAANPPRGWQTQVARNFNVSKTTISRIASGKSWH